MKKNSVITIVIAALLCVCAFGVMSAFAVPAGDSIQVTSGKYMEDPQAVTFMTQDSRITLFVEKGSKFGPTPDLPESSDGRVWHWYIDGTETEFTADTEVNADMTVRAVMIDSNPGNDFMHGASGILAVAKTNNSRGEQAMQGWASSHGDSNGVWLAGKDMGVSGGDPATVWSFEFAGSCNSEYECYYHVRADNGKYLKIDSTGIFAVDDSSSEILVKASDSSISSFSLYDADGNYRANLKSDNYKKGFQSTNSWGAASFHFYNNEARYQVEFNVDGGDYYPRPYTIKAAMGDTVTLPDYPGTKNGHKFLGWSLSQTVERTADYKAGASYDVEGNVTFIAVYDSNMFLWFDARGGSVPVPGFYQGDLNGKKYPESVRDGFRLEGWTENPLDDSSVVYEPGAPIELELDTDKTVYAVWKETANVTFVPVDSPSVTYVVDCGEKIDVSFDTNYPNAEKWMYIEEGGSAAYVEGEFTVPKYDVTLYEVTEATIIFDPNGGTVDPVSISKNTGEVIIFDGEVSASRGDNFKLLGWKDQNGFIYDNQYIVAQKDQTLTAVWGYTVYFDVNGGRPNQQSLDVVLGEGNSVFPAYSGKKGNNDFIGWTTKLDADGKPVYEQGDTLYQAGQSLEENGEPIDFKYYALYNVTLSFNNNGGGNISPANKVENLVPYAGSVNLDDYKAQIGTKTFFGWSESKTDHTLLTGTYTIGGADKTLYAAWGSTVTFKTYGINDVVMPDPEQGFTDQTFKTKMLDAYRGRAFTGWTDGTNIYEPNTDVAFPAADTTFYAVWDGQVTVRFNVNGGSAADLPSYTVQPGDEVDFPAYSGTKKNSKFIGWTDSSNLKDGKYHKIYGIGDKYKIPLNSGSNITFYAAWDLDDAQKKDNVKFGIRLDNSIPYEPSNYANSEYTTRAGIDKGNVVFDNTVLARQWVADNDPSLSKLNGTDADEGKKRYYIVNDVTRAVGGIVPTAEQINSIMESCGRSFDPETEYVLWYVLKWQGNGEGRNLWHVDGVVLQKNLASLVYDGNFDGKADNMPTGFQEMDGTEVTVGADGKKTNVTNKIPVRGDNFKFMGWNTKADGTGTMYQNGEDKITLHGVTVLYAIWDENEQIVTLKKEWNDNEDNGHYRPDSVGVTLKLSSGKTYRRWLTPYGTDADGNPSPWTVSIRIPVYDNKNRVITWTWQEDSVPNYTLESQYTSDLVTTFKNKLVLIPVSGTKTWADNETSHPAVTVQLYANEVLLDGQIKEATDANLTYTFENLPEKTKDGKSIVYTVQEINPPAGYKVSYDGMDVTNSHYYVTIKAADLVKETYDGTPLVMTNKNYTSTGLRDNDSISDLTLSAERTDAGTTNGIKASNATIVDKEGNDVTELYTINYEPGSLTVGRKPVTVTVKDATKVYGEQDPSWEIKSIEGRISDTDTITWNTITREEGEDVKEGGYAITATGLNIQGNYEVSYVPGTLTITPAEVTVTANPQEKFYGSSDPVLTAAVEGLKRNDSETVISYTLSREEGQNVGEYKITPTGNTEQGNYTVSFYTGTLVIKPKPITIEAASLDKEYDGTERTANDYNHAVDQDLVYGDTFETVEIIGSIKNVLWVNGQEGDVENKVGTVKIVNGENDATGNYSITRKSGKLTLHPIELTIEAETASKKFDGTPLTCNDTSCKDPYYKLSRVIPDILSDVVVEGSQLNVGSSENVVKSWTFSNDAITRSNYKVTTKPGTLTVWDVDDEVIITGRRAEKVYDAEPLTCTDSSCYSVAGLEDGDYLAYIDVNGTQTVVNEVNPTANVLSNWQFKNQAGLDVTQKYKNVTVVNGELIVHPKHMSLTTGSRTAEYNGTALRVNSYIPRDLAGNDHVDRESVHITGSQTNAGESKNNIERNVHILNDNGQDVTNCYIIDYIIGTLTVTPKPVIVTVDSNPSTALQEKFEKEYGQIDPEFTARVTGTLGGDRVDYAFSREEGEEPGDYVINVFDPQGRVDNVQGNYIVTYVPGILTINYNRVSFTAMKVWVDDNNRDGIRPISLGVTLVGSDGTVRSRRLTEANGWIATIDELPVFGDGAQITYYWTEEAVDGYTGKSEVNGNVTTFTNTHEISRTSASVNKIWDDNDNAGNNRPATLGVILQANGERILGRTLSPENNWSLSVDNLPVNENGSPISYVWFEQSVGGGYYAVSSTTSGNNTTLVNSNIYTLTIHYQFADGTTAAADYVAKLAAGEVFTVVSPEIKGYVTNQTTVAGIMPSHDMEITVIYVAEGETIVTPTPTPMPYPVVPTDEPEIPPAPTKDLPEPREVDPDDDHPLVIPVPNMLVEIDGYNSALGLGEVFINGGGYSLE